MGGSLTRMCFLRGPGPHLIFRRKHWYNATDSVNPDRTGTIWTQELSLRNICPFFRTYRNLVFIVSPTIHILQSVYLSISLCLSRQIDEPVMVSCVNYQHGCIYFRAQDCKITPVHVHGQHMVGWHTLPTFHSPANPGSSKDESKTILNPTTSPQKKKWHAYHVCNIVGWKI